MCQKCNKFEMEKLVNVEFSRFERFKKIKNEKNDFFVITRNHCDCKKKRVRKHKVYMFDITI